MTSAKINMLGVFAEHTGITVLTFTNKAANIVNNIVSESLFQGCEPIACVQLDNNDEPRIFSIIYES